MIDRPLMITLLTTLEECHDLAGGIEENQLFDHINLRANRAITTTLLNEHLGMASGKGWIDWSLDMLKARRWRITIAGRAALADLKDNG